MFTDVLLANHNTILALAKTVVYFGKAFKFTVFLTVLTTPLEALKRISKFKKDHTITLQD